MFFIYSFKWGRAGHFGSRSVICKEDLSQHTSEKKGGTVDIFLKPCSRKIFKETDNAAGVMAGFLADFWDLADGVPIFQD